ncbi:MAG: Rieske 2Fe-2S domain-containing protein [Cyclobacteriaceae bacterium]
MNRKLFLKVVGGSCLTFTGASMLAGCSTAHSVSATVQDDKLIVSKNEFIEIKKDEERIRDVVLVRTPSLAFPIAVYGAAQQAYRALWMKCTHKGCELNARPDYLACPCHGSEFDAQGQVINGPAESNLKTLAITTDHENIYIYL